MGRLAESVLLPAERMRRTRLTGPSVGSLTTWAELPVAESVMPPRLPCSKLFSAVQSAVPPCGGGGATLLSAATR